MNIGEDFKFRDDKVKDKKETVPIELLTGPFKGVILRYTQVSIKENQNETATLQFAYDLLKIPNRFSEVGLRKNEKFSTHIGLVLNTLILEAVGTENEHGALNSKEPVTE